MSGDGNDFTGKNKLELEAVLAHSIFEVSYQGNALYKCQKGRVQYRYHIILGTKHYRLYIDTMGEILWER